ncbi:jmjC domain-containing protein 8 [Rhincodon typus]|uniref:jmjC domain-containing protein 8 n=1 Tax=Rhincodon typus TaxID=259920 RepID=UPI00202E6052|nr:jmjC domain-containing protein 8 [Rhincodon typus]
MKKQVHKKATKKALEKPLAKGLEKDMGITVQVSAPWPVFSVWPLEVAGSESRWRDSFPVRRDGMEPRILLAVLLLAVGDAGGLQADGGWKTDRSTQMIDQGPCNVELRDSLTYSEFVHQYAYSKPVIIRGITTNEQFRALCSKQSLLQEFGNRLVRLSTANTYSYQKVDVPFKEYVEHMMKPQSLDSLGSETLYFFGDNNFTEWDSLFRTYIQPPYQLPGTTGAYSFGIAG